MILDNIIVFVVQSILLLLRERRTKRWPIATGTVIASYSAEFTSYPEAQLVYKYEVNGKCRIGEYARPFYFSNSAREFAKQSAPSTTLFVRYKPADADRSFVRRCDQLSQITPSVPQATQV